MTQRGENTNELWRAMQAAFNRYKNASAVLDALMATSAGDAALSERDLNIEAAAGIQRAAFESYIEARLQLSEFLVSWPNTESQETVVSQEPQKVLSAPKSCVRILLATVAILLLLTAFALRDLAQDRRQIAGLETARRETNAALTQKQHQVQALVREMEALKASNDAMAKSARAVSKALQTRRARSVRTPWSRVAPNSGRIAKNGQEPFRRPKQGPTYRELALRPSKHFESGRSSHYFVQEGNRSGTALAYQMR